ncbi:RTA1 like protein-domain-containing protein [Butyriboletus roseoflavus]|nr:RTA1 like protein-domain-containing protein [Butyriboletus roseoflavus]
MAYLRLACLVHFLFLMSTVAAQATSTAASYPTATESPTLIQQSFVYNPSKAAAGIFAALYGITTLVIFFRLFSNRAWWGLCLPIGAAFMTAGFVLRIEMTIYPNSLPTYLCSELFTLLSPTAFLAFNYILYGRFVVRCIERRHSLIRPERTARYFIISDVTTFLVQGAGGSFMTSTNPKTIKTGAYIVIAGLSLQTFSFALFIFFVYHASRSLKREGIKPHEAPWGTILTTLFFSSTLILIRCIYRTIEIGEIFGNGYLNDHEAFFYVLDALPLFIGITSYAIYWPTPYLQPSADILADEMNKFAPSERSYVA